MTPHPHPHPALDIPDIVSEIFAHLESDPPALARLARVCRAWWEPACAVLWREIYGVQRFLRLLPDVYQQELEQCSGWTFRTPTEADGERVKLYASFVKELGIHPGRPPYGPPNGPNPRRTMERRGLPMLMLLRPFGAPFPNLTRLHAIAETDDSLCGLSRLLSPMLQSLYVQTLQGDNFMVGHFLRAIPVNAPSLQTLEVEALGALSKESENSLLSAAKRVSKLSLQAVSPSESFISRLAEDNRLRSLVMELTLARTYPMERWTAGTFDLLEEFEGEALSAPRTLLLLEAIAMPKLRRLRLTIGTVPLEEVYSWSARQWSDEPVSVRRLSERIATFTQLKVLRLVLPSLDDARLTLSSTVFLPLSGCSNIESFVLEDRSDSEGYDSVFVEWDDEHVIALVQNWPKLHTLHLECTNKSAPHTQITPRLLPRLARLCPDLRSLRIPLNMATDEKYGPWSSLPPPSKRMARLTLEASSLIVNEEPIADLIKALWPEAVVMAWKEPQGLVMDEITTFASMYRERYPV